MDEDLKILDKYTSLNTHTCKHRLDRSFWTSAPNKVPGKKVSSSCHHYHLCHSFGGLGFTSGYVWWRIVPIGHPQRLLKFPRDPSRSYTGCCVFYDRQIRSYDHYQHHHMFYVISYQMDGGVEIFPDKSVVLHIPAQHHITTYLNNTTLPHT